MGSVKLNGPWESGYALDYYCFKSKFRGHGFTGSVEFECVPTEIGGLVRKLKYDRNSTALTPIVDLIVEFLSEWNPPISSIVPVPPSDMSRPSQPVMEISKKLCKKLNLSLRDICVEKTRPTRLVKDTPISERKSILAGVFSVDKKMIVDQNVLLFDDIFDSGATVTELTNALLRQGKAASVYLLTLAKTRKAGR